MPLSDLRPIEVHPAVFIVAASSRLARTRAERLVVVGVQSLRRDVSTEEAAFLDLSRQADGRIHAWSIRDASLLAKHWERARPGDWMLFYQMGFITIAARVRATIESEAIAGGMWGPGEAKDLRRIVFFDEAWPIWASVWPHANLIGSRFLGFRRVAEDRQAAIREKHGSLDAFVRKALIPKKRPARSTHPAR